MTFEELMRCHPDNQSVYDDLLDQVKKFNVTPFVGAGLTTWAGFPQWKTLLTDMAATISPGFQKKVEALLEGSKLDRYETAASRVQDKLGIHEFHRKLRAAFPDEQLESRAEDRPAYQSLLPKLFPRVWVTTNFDRGIEHLFSWKLDAVTPLDKYYHDRIERALHNQEPLLLKLHGDIQDTSKLVLTKKSYNNAYAGGQPMPKMLRDVFKRGPMLFLGCSLEQDRTMKVLSKCSKNAEQFAVLKLPSETVNEDDIFAPQRFNADGNEKPEFRNRRRGLSKLRIRCIWYPAVPKNYAGNIHDEALAALFRQLAADMGIAESAAELPDIRNAEFLSEIFLFRDDERKTVAEAIRTPGGRCAVTGEPGVGKTELCLRVREDGPFPKKQFLFVRTEGAENLLMLFSDVVEALSEKLPEGTGYEATGEWLLGLLVTRGVKALYLDNFEDILAALRDGDPKEQRCLWRWLNAVQREKISCLLSSRELPPTNIFPCKEVPLKGFTPEQSWAVFLQYLGREPKDSEKAAFEALLTELDGHPLAIALTAAQARSELSLNDLLDCWQEVEQEMPDERHSSLKTALTVTWKRLEKVPGARMLWGVFAFGSGQISRETLDWLYEGLKAFQRQAVHACFAAGILRANEARTGWEMSVPIKEQFFLLADDEEKEAAVAFWLIRLIPLLKDADVDSDPERQLPAHRRVLSLLPDCLSVLEHLLRWLPRKPLITALDRGLCNYYPFDPTSISVLSGLTAYYHGEQDDFYLANTLRSWGNLAYMQGDSSAADKLYREAEELYRKIGNTLGLANTLQSRGDLAYMQSDYGEADKRYREAEELYRKIGGTLGLANTLQSRGDLAYMQDDYGKADGFYREAEELFRKIGDTLGLANTLKSWGNLARLQDDYGAADKRYREAEELYREIGNTLGLANTLKSRGDLAGLQGDYGEADRRYREAEELFRKIGGTLGLANTLRSWGDLAYMQDDYGKADKRYREAEELYRKIGDTLGLANTLHSRGELAYMQDNFGEADGFYREAEELFRKIGDTLGLANTLQSRGNLAFIQVTDSAGYQAAKNLYLQAKELYEFLQTPIGLAYTYALLYQCCRHLNEPSEAAEYRQKAVALLPRLPANEAAKVKKILSL